MSLTRPRLRSRPCRRSGCAGHPHDSDAGPMHTGRRVRRGRMSSAPLVRGRDRDPPFPVRAAQRRGRPGPAAAAAPPSVGPPATMIGWPATAHPNPGAPITAAGEARPAPSLASVPAASSDLDVAEPHLRSCVLAGRRRHPRPPGGLSRGGPPMPLTLVTGPANAEKARVVLDGYRAALRRGEAPILVVPTFADVERYRARARRRRPRLRRAGRALRVAARARSPGAPACAGGRCRALARERVAAAAASRRRRSSALAASAATRRLRARAAAALRRARGGARRRRSA